MEINHYSIPETVESAVDALIASLSPEEVLQIKMSKPEDIHFTAGRYLRNNWGLWSKDSAIKRDAVNQYKIAHADDISGLIFEWVFAKVNGEEFDPFEHCVTYHKHWANYGMTALTAGGWPPSQETKNA